MKWLRKKYWEGDPRPESVEPEVTEPESVEIIEDDAERQRRAVDLVLNDFADNRHLYMRMDIFPSVHLSRQHANGAHMSVLVYDYRASRYGMVSLGGIQARMPDDEAVRIIAELENAERDRRVREESAVLAQFPKAAGEA